MATLFVSDLHLDSARADKLDLFLEFLRRARADAEQIYILGDLFEIWIGDDDDAPVALAVVEGLRQLAAAGVAVFVAHGNRDFLFGRRFVARTGATLLPDYAVIDLYGRRTLLMHGDLLCTRDVKYQRFRRVVRNPLLRGLFLAAPLAWRKRVALKTQSGTQASMARKDAAIMDVAQPAVEAAMTRYTADLLIHGHTHRPGVHDFAIDGAPCRRIVLGDWYEADSVLVCEGSAQTSMRITDYLGSEAQQV